MNSSHLIGRLTKDPILKYTPGKQTPVSRFILAVNENTKEKEIVNYIPVVVYGKRAEGIATYLSRGSRIAIEGKIQTRKYKKENQTLFFTEVKANYVQYLDNKKRQDNNEVIEINEENTKMYEDYLNTPVDED